MVTTPEKANEPTFVRFAPNDIYAGLARNNADVAANEAKGIVNVRNILYKPTGTVFLDTFIANLHQYGYQLHGFHAQRLGVDERELSATLHVLTGMYYREFVESYFLPIIEDLYNIYPKHMKWISETLGFRSYSGFYRYGVRHGKKKWFRYGFNYEYEQRMKKKPVEPSL